MVFLRVGALSCGGLPVAGAWVSPLLVRCARAPPRLLPSIRGFLWYFGGALFESRACMQVYRVGRCGRYPARESAAHFASGGLSVP